MRLKARLLAALCLGAVTVAVPALVAAQDSVLVRPPGARPVAQSVEHNLWTASADAEREAMRSALRIENEALQAYVREVTCKVVPDHCPDVRVQAFRRPAFNAFVMPNGYIEVWSGLMLRASNEAELAFVLAHEGAHFTGNHSLRQWESAKRTQGALLALSIVASAAASFDANYVDYGRYVDVLTTAAYLGGLASLFAYSREFEFEADAVGQQRLAAAGYDPRAAANIWRTVIRLDQSSDNERVRRSESRGSVFRTHPLTMDRLTALETQAASLPVGQGRFEAAPGTGELGEARYRAMIRPFLAAWLRDELRGRDFGATLALLTQLEAGGDPGVTGYFKGEVYRLRRSAGDEDRAIAAYQAATSHADCPPEAWRELGTSLNRRGDRAGALAAFEAYIAHAPAAPDAQLVARQIERLRAAISNPSS